MIAKLRKWINQTAFWIKSYWDSSPWIESVVVLWFPITGALFLNSKLPAAITVDISAMDSQLKLLSYLILLIIYFFLVAIFSEKNLRFERKLRSWGQSFRYDNRGTLYNGQEPNIAFRVETFKRILEGIGGVTESALLTDALIDTGRKAGEDFAENLKSIYASELAQQKGNVAWDDLPLERKLNQWAEYDSSTGWGMLSCKLMKDLKVKVSITHLQGLFKGPGGLMFGNILGGYCETVISRIVTEHGGKFTDCTQVKFNADAANSDLGERYTLELIFDIK